MGDIFKHIFEFIFLKTKKNSQKIFYLLSIIALLLLLNDYFGITKNIIINRKLNQFEKLRQIAPESFAKDSLIQTEIIVIRKEITDKSTFVEKSRIFLRNQFHNILTWRNFSACFSILFGILIVPFFIERKKSPLRIYLFTIFIVELVLFVIAFILVKILSIIPEFKYPWLNILLNIVIQIPFLIPGLFKKNK